MKRAERKKTHHNNKPWIKKKTQPKNVRSAVFIYTISASGAKKTKNINALQCAYSVHLLWL